MARPHPPVLSSPPTPHTKLSSTAAPTPTSTLTSWPSSQRQQQQQQQVVQQKPQQKPQQKHHLFWSSSLDDGCLENNQYHQPLQHNKTHNPCCCCYLCSTPTVTVISRSPNSHDNSKGVLASRWLESKAKDLALNTPRRSVRSMKNLLPLALPAFNSSSAPSASSSSSSSSSSSPSFLCSSSSFPPLSIHHQNRNQNQMATREVGDNINHNTNANKTLASLSSSPSTSIPTPSSYTATSSSSSYSTNNPSPTALSVLDSHISPPTTTTKPHAAAIMATATATAASPLMPNNRKDQDESQSESVMGCNFAEFLADDLAFSKSVFESKNMTAGPPLVSLAVDYAGVGTPYSTTTTTPCASLSGNSPSRMVPLVSPAASSTHHSKSIPRMGSLSAIAERNSGVIDTFDLQNIDETNNSNNITNNQATPTIGTVSSRGNLRSDYQTPQQHQTPQIYSEWDGTSSDDEEDGYGNRSSDGDSAGQGRHRASHQGDGMFSEDGLLEAMAMHFQQSSITNSHTAPPSIAYSPAGMSPAVESPWSNGSGVGGGLGIPSVVSSKALEHAQSPQQRPKTADEVTVRTIMTGNLPLSASSQTTFSNPFTNKHTVGILPSTSSPNMRFSSKIVSLPSSPSSSRKASMASMAFFNPHPASAADADVDADALTNRRTSSQNEGVTVFSDFASDPSTAQASTLSPAGKLSVDIPQRRSSLANRFSGFSPRSTNSPTFSSVSRQSLLARGDASSDEDDSTNNNKRAQESITVVKKPRKKAPPQPLTLDLQQSNRKPRLTNTHNENDDDDDDDENDNAGADHGYESNNAGSDRKDSDTLSRQHLEVVVDPPISPLTPSDSADFPFRLQQPQPYQRQRRSYYDNPNDQRRHRTLSSSSPSTAAATSMMNVQTWLETSILAANRRSSDEFSGRNPRLASDLMESLRISTACFPETMLLTSSLSVEKIREFSRRIHRPSTDVAGHSRKNGALYDPMASTMANSSSHYHHHHYQQQQQQHPFPPKKFSWSRVLSSKRNSSITSTASAPPTPPRSLSHSRIPSYPSPLTPEPSVFDHPNNSVSLIASAAPWTPLKTIFNASSDYLCDALYAHIIVYNYVSSLCPRRVPVMNQSYSGYADLHGRSLGVGSGPLSSRQLSSPAGMSMKVGGGASSGSGSGASGASGMGAKGSGEERPKLPRKAASLLGILEAAACAEATTATATPTAIKRSSSLALPSSLTSPIGDSHEKPSLNTNSGDNHNLNSDASVKRNRPTPHHLTTSTSTSPTWSTTSAWVPTPTSKHHHHSTTTSSKVTSPTTPAAAAAAAATGPNTASTTPLLTPIGPPPPSAADQSLWALQEGLATCIARLVATLKVCATEDGPLEEEVGDVDPFFMRSLCEVVRSSEETA